MNYIGKDLMESYSQRILQASRMLTGPKPHKPTRIPKLCQRACFANADKIVLKKFPNASKKIKTHQRTARQTITLKPNTDNGLQTRMTEHQLPTFILLVEMRTKKNATRI